ncbi:hypothetical protein [Ruegeria atlantica]|uniref:hypothetical protein n=1 Tax=Ruegeria atlantica TaxID=81569 RepID=UPI0024951B08|nr:hypothetical protein [Ruegeria atlantica]
MVIVYLLSGPLVAALCFVAFILNGMGVSSALLFGFLIGMCTPLLIMGLKVLWGSKLRLKLAGKLPLKSGS